MPRPRKTYSAPLIQLRRSGVHGYGLFARDFVPQGERVIEYVGERITKAEAQRRYPHLKVTLKTADALLLLAYAQEKQL